MSSPRRRQVLVPVTTCPDEPSLSCCSQKDVQQLTSILCTPTLNADIRRSAADQLLSLTAHQRFQPQLSEPAIIHTLLQELTHSLPNLASCCSNVRGTGASAEDSSMDEQQLPVGDMQLPIACLRLLVAMLQHCQQQTRALLLGDPDR